MPGRPFFNERVTQLAARCEVAISKSDMEQLRLVEQELQQRNSRKAQDLLMLVQRVLAAMPGTPRTARDYPVEPSEDDSEAADGESPADPPVALVPIEWSADQKAILEGDEDGSLVVEAGPGTGKTATACAKVAYLVEKHGLAASNILLISFTRTAVREIRDRIEAYANEPRSVAGLRIVTLDSFTWQVLKGLGDVESDGLFGSYEGNIRAFIAMLKERDADIQGFLDELEHVFIDEAQDLVGDRADLCIELIRALPEKCGVTVFADSAQAIYGFTDDSGSRGARSDATFVERMLGDEVNGFVINELNEVHRTRDAKLRKLFQEGRARLLRRTASDIDGWRQMAELIGANAHGDSAPPWSESFRNPAGHLFLYRTRAEVLMASSRLWSINVPHTLRMSGTQDRIHPWIARVLGCVEEDHIERRRFEKLWEERACEELTSVADAWNLLSEHAGDRAGRVRLPRLREVLGRERPPMNLVMADSDHRGLIIGTIHASKGREASHVHLMMPPESFFRDTEKRHITPSEYAEEERVLFVGATRARKTLKVGNGRNLFASKLESGRSYRRVKKTWRNARQVEIGLKSDIEAAYLVSNARPRFDVENTQDWLWRVRSMNVELVARYDHTVRRNLLYTQHEPTSPLFALSRSCGNDLLAIAQLIGKRRPYPEIRHIRLVGAATCVLRPDERNTAHGPWSHSGLVLMPVISAYTTIFFKR